MQCVWWDVKPDSVNQYPVFVATVTCSVDIMLHALIYMMSGVLLQHHCFIPVFISYCFAVLVKNMTVTVLCCC